MARRLSPHEYEHAVQRARREDLTEPRAHAADYEHKSGLIVVELRNGAKFVFPSDLVQGLAGEDSKDLGSIEIPPFR